MAAIRTTQRMMVSRVISDYRRNTSRVMSLQKQLSTGQRINAPSDDPIDARRSLNTRTIIQKSEQYLSNINMTRPQSNQIAAVIEQSQEIVRRAHELTMRGANTTNGQEQLNALAEEINQLLEGMYDAANQRTDSRYIFAGTRTRSAAFSATRNAQNDITAVTYEGNTENVTIAISDTVNAVINEPGSTVFQGGTDIFQVLINTRDDMLAGNYSALSNARLTELDQARGQLSSAIARVGSVQNRVERVETETEEYADQNTALLSSIRDADFADVMINYNAAQNALQASLQAAARVLRPSLLDYVG